jgi:hypothetical protein
MKKVINWFLNPPVTGQSTILIIRLMSLDFIISTSKRGYGTSEKLWPA